MRLARAAVPRAARTAAPDDSAGWRGPDPDCCALTRPPEPPTVAYWTLSDHVTTDLAMLMAALTAGDEPVAARIASRIGPPLPSLRADWIDDHAGGAPREELRAAADDALAAAAERWPHNTAFDPAADRLYEDA